MVLPSEEQYQNIKEKSLSGRYITNADLIDFLERSGNKDKVDSTATSVENRTIFALSLGTGMTKVLIWSQMHGNETTTTKGVLDLINYLNTKDEQASEILLKCTLIIIPILNPDGARSYTRVNANNVDLNRDARELSQPESNYLKKIYDDFQPDYCFNLHDQRSIFNVGNTAMPATLSFLAPARDPERTISEARKRSMQLIAAMEKELKLHIPGQIGRYDDAFNPNCVGDSFQMLGTPTILFEAGHYPGDYQREITRRYIFNSLVVAMYHIAENQAVTYGVEAYFAIPENNKQFFDVLVKNAHKINRSFADDEDIGVLYREVLERDTIIFKPYIETTVRLKTHFGHIVYDCQDPRDLQKLKKDRLVYALLL